MSGDAGPAQAQRQFLLVSRRELAVRMRGTAFRVSTIILLIVTAAVIAIPVKLIGGPQHFTIAVTAGHQQVPVPRGHLAPVQGYPRSQKGPDSSPRVSVSSRFSE